MLYMLGPVIFEIWPVNLTDIEKTSEAGIVDKPVLSRRPPLEFVGDGPQTMRMNAKLFPQKFGGVGTVATLDAMKSSGLPQYLMRGDGVPQGWFMVDRISERHTYLDARGVGKVVDVSIELRRSDPPNVADFFSSIVGLLP